MATVKFTPEELRNIANKLQNEVTELTNDLSSIDNLLEEVKTAWTGADSNAFYTKAKEKRESIKEVVSIIETLPEGLNKIATEAEAAERDLAGA